MTTERQLSALPTQGTPDFVVRIAEVMPMGSGDVTSISDADMPRDDAGSGDSVSTIVVPFGELDYFSVQQLTDSAAGLMVGTLGSVTFDLSAVLFCDSSICVFLDWVDGLGDEIEVTVVTSPAIERVLGLFSGGSR